MGGHQGRPRTAKRSLLIDAPGHAEFLRNMITGAARTSPWKLSAQNKPAEPIKPAPYLPHRFSVSVAAQAAIGDIDEGLPTGRIRLKRNEKLQHRRYTTDISVNAVA